MFHQRDARAVYLEGHEASLYLGQGPAALEVVHVTLDARPTVTLLRSLLKERIGRRASPVLILASWGDGRAAVAGPTEHNAVELVDLPAAQVEGIAEKALAAENRHQAIRVVHQLLPQLDDPVPGMRNGGLFAMHELRHGVPTRDDWTGATERSNAVRTTRGRRLLNQLGYEIEELPGPAMILVAEARKRAVAVLLNQPEQIDASSDRFDGVSPVSYALAQADRENLDFVVVLAGSTLRAYPSKPGVGSGRRGRTETFIEVNLDLLREDQAGYLWLLFSSDALADAGSFHEILGRSEDYAAELGRRLRERVYEEVVPRLATAIGEATLGDSPTQADLRHVYELALRVLYRLLFVAYAEDRDLLPLHTSNVYREHSLKRIAQRLAEAGERDVEFGDGEGLWTEVRQIWRAVSRGNPEWDVPAYNGSLFSSDRATSPLGAELDQMALPDRAVAAALEPLLLADTGEGTIGPVDFRSLGVREFGTIYEGLLESEVSLAETDLTVDPKTGAYLPADEGNEVVVPAGGLYLHNQSGARKSTGSYYTKSFAVEHLLDRALEPALEEHLERISALSDREAGRRFFEFRVSDIAMGSGHFLVAAIDRIERRLVSYLAERPLPDVKEELNRLRRVAHENLGEDWAGDPIEDAQLIRRQIARRCIFGVDLNPMAVELARVSIWIHTFVPGLPLSLMDQNLVQGNALVGIATFEEASELLQAESGSLFSFVASERLADVREPLEKLGRLTDANDAEIREARELYQQLRSSTQDEKELFTVLTASRTNRELREAVEQGQIATRHAAQGDAFWRGLVENAENELGGLDPFHFPLAFPHVFLGQRRGFDVIVGNPPWKAPVVHELEFWARHYPGLRGLRPEEQRERVSKLAEDRPDLQRVLEAEISASEKVRQSLVGGGFSGMGTGDPDFYKAFVWRFWALVSPDGGRIGVVLPRSALMAKGSADFRRAILSKAEAVDLTLLVNSGRWAFEMEARYTIGLASITRRPGEGRTSVSLGGPYRSLAGFNAGKARAPTQVYGEEVLGWNDHASFPLLPDDRSISVFRSLRRSPRLDLDEPGGWRARPYGEAHAGKCRAYLLAPGDDRRGAWPVYKGESFTLDDPDTGELYGWADPTVMEEWLQSARERQVSGSAYAEFSPEWASDPRMAPWRHPRVAYRDVARSTDTRTVLVSVVPPDRFLTDKAPYFLFPRGTVADQLFLFSVLRSRPLDWYARRYVETGVKFYLMNGFPIPRPDQNNALRSRAIEIGSRLAFVDERFAEWADELGVAPQARADDERQDLSDELDAVVAHLFGLSANEIRHVFETFHEGWDYEERLRATLEHFKAWSARS